MITVLVLAPVLGRPESAAPLVRSLRAARHPRRVIETDIMFICSPGDDVQRAAVQELLYGGPNNGHVLSCTVEWEPGPGDYARKINYGATIANPDFYLLGADDLTFHEGWAEAAVAEHLLTGACVIGTNDLGNTSVMKGNHATHPLVSRHYLECGTADEPDSGKIIHEGYDHNFCDTELVATAKARGTFAAAWGSHVEHHHPLWGKAQRDATYLKADEHFHEDRALFQSRSHMWDQRAMTPATVEAHA